MRLMRLLLAGVVGAAVALGSTGAAYAGRLVYMGPDPACHTSHPQAGKLAANAIRWAGNGSDPRILLVKASCGSNAVTMLSTALFTQVTAIDESSFSSQTLSNFDVIYVTYTSEASNFASSAANVLAFINAGGGLVIEGNADSISWAPFGDQVGLAGIGDNTTTIVDPAHVIMAGLTDSGLSGWNSSSHSEFLTPPPRFVTLTVDGNGSATIIVFAGVVSPQGAAPVLSWPAIAGLVMLLLTCGLYGLRRTTSI